MAITRQSKAPAYGMAEASEMRGIIFWGEGLCEVNTPRPVRVASDLIGFGAGEINFVYKIDNIADEPYFSR
jgi:hypothetical protein